MAAPKRIGYLRNLLVAIDQLGNAIASGSADETISSRLGRWKADRKVAGLWPPHPLHPAWWLDVMLDTIDPGHTESSIETPTSPRHMDPPRWDPPKGSPVKPKDKLR